MGNTSISLGIGLAVAVLSTPGGASASEDKEGLCEKLGAPDSYAEVRFEAFVRKEGHEARPEDAVEAEVLINGAEVGKTPLGECLPQGEYFVEIWASGHLPFTKEVKIAPGSSRTIVGEFTVPLTEEEVEELRKKRAEEIKQEKQDKERAGKEKLKRWRAEVKEWELETAPIVAQRKPYISYGVAFLASGVGLIALGSVLEGGAVDNNNKAEEINDLWLDSNDPQDTQLLDKVDEYQRKRNIYHAFGLPCLILGGAAAVTSAVVFAWMPRLPPKPKRPRGPSAPLPGPSLEIVPTFGGGLMGGEMRLWF